MSCKNRILLARLVAGIKSHDIRKGLLCISWLRFLHFTWWN
jgi:hypothetical protein